jgi:hypothetical protein
VTKPTFTTEKPLRFDRISGLDAEQLDELEQMVGELLEKPWDQGTGRSKELTLREALIVTSGYMRAVSIGHDDTMLRDQLIEDLDRFPPA